MTVQKCLLNYKITILYYTIDHEKIHNNITYLGIVCPVNQWWWFRTVLYYAS